MTKIRSFLFCLALASAGIAALVVWFPRAFPAMPTDWEINRGEAEAIALETFRDLGPRVEAPYRLTTLGFRPLTDQQIRKADVDGELWGSRLGRNLVQWETTVWNKGANPNDWTYKAWVSTRGEVTSLRHRLPEDELEGAIDEAAARERADTFLAAQGWDLATLGEPEVRTVDRQDFTETSLRYRDRTNLLGEEVPYGVSVTFRGEELEGFHPYIESPDEEAFGQGVTGFILLQQVWLFLPVLLAPIVAIFFLRRYHAGEVGVRRGMMIFLISAVSGVLYLVLCARANSEGWNFGIPRHLTTLLTVVQMMLFYFLPAALLGFLGWSVGEVRCRERHPRRLAGFDAIFRRNLANSTVGWDSLRGITGGLVLAGLTALVVASLPSDKTWVPTAFQMGPWWFGTGWFGLGILFMTVPSALYQELFGRQLLASGSAELFARWFRDGRGGMPIGSWVGGLVAAGLAGVAFFPPVVITPLRWGILVAVLYSCVLVFLFLRFGLLSSLLASLSSTFLLELYPFLTSQDSWMRFQAAIPLFIVSLPMLLSARWLFSDKKFFYSYDDVPPHVRRIAERERQRVELETARRIQSSILPELPPSLHGVEIAHAYLPASEVGGDFYDVLALEDGRLAVAIGDVAGHGVSSGLVMSMARSALAVQVTYHPEVAAVFSTLNRVIYQSARKRLLATLCYAVLDPRERELFYASAGHLYPYLISREGRLRPLEYTAYPLGVRDDLSVEARVARLAAITRPSQRRASRAASTVSTRGGPSTRTRSFAAPASSTQRSSELISAPRSNEWCSAKNFSSSTWRAE